MNFKAIFIGVITYPFLLVLWLFIAPQYEHKTVHIYSIVMASLYVFLPFISGYITAYFAQEKVILNGLICATVLAVFSGIGWFILDILSMYMLFNLLSIVVLGTAGAMVYYWRNKRVKSATL